MAHQNVCSRNKYGFCKFRNACRNQHIMEKCCIKQCEIHTCSRRHPKICKYFRDIGYCKFGEWCLFSHSIKNSKDLEDKEIKELFEKLKAVEDKLEEKSKLIEKLENVISEFEENMHLKLICKKWKQKFIHLKATWRL